jgi:hypothetical protein
MYLHNQIPAQHSDHLPLEAGELDIMRYIELARKQNCRVLVETKALAGPRQSVNCLKGRNCL